MALKGNHMQEILKYIAPSNSSGSGVFDTHDNISLKEEKMLPERNVIIALAMISFIFILDILVPLGISVWLFYIMPLFLAAPVLKRSRIYLFLSVTTILIIFGFFLAPPGGNPTRAVINRILGICVLSLTSFLLIKHKQAEANSSRLASAVEAAADAVVITSSEGGIQYVNPAFEKITGYTGGEALGRNLHMLDSGKHDESFYREIRERLRSEATWTGRMTQKKKDGNLYEEECTYSKVKDKNGATINYVAIKRDITEKLRYESIAAATETMNNIGYIFSGVRHEIGNPISSTSMLLNLLKRNLTTLDKAAIKGYIDRSLGEIAKVDYLLRTLRNFNMYEKLEIQKIPVQDFMQKFIFLVREDFTKKGIEITDSIDEHADFFHADPRALHQVLINLLANATDALQERDKPRIAITVCKTDGVVRVQMQDNGCGMTEEQQKNLFKPFHTTKTHGTGMGMVIVKRMLTGMNGTIKISSQKNVGTVVEIVLQ